MSFMTMQAAGPAFEETQKTISIPGQGDGVLDVFVVAGGTVIVETLWFEVVDAPPGSGTLTCRVFVPAQVDLPSLIGWAVGRSMSFRFTGTEDSDSVGSLASLVTPRLMVSGKKVQWETVSNLDTPPPLGQVTFWATWRPLTAGATLNAA